jgi:hypothetical protein
MVYRAKKSIYRAFKIYSLSLPAPNDCQQKAKYQDKRENPRIWNCIWDDDVSLPLTADACITRDDFCQKYGGHSLTVCRALKCAWAGKNACWDQQENIP